MAAVAALKRKEVSRLILTRPAVEAGEHLGFHPVIFQDKVDPTYVHYMMPCMIFWDRRFTLNTVKR